MREIVGNLIEKYQFLDSFGTDLGGRDRCGDGEINRRRCNRNLTNLDLTGRGGEEIVICADGCCINGGDGGLDMVECLQFVDDFWMWV